MVVDEAEETAKRQNRQQEIEKKKKNAPVIDVQQPAQPEPKVDGSETPSPSTETLQETQVETPEPPKEEKSEASPEGKIEEPKTAAEHREVIDEEQKWLDEHQEAGPAEREQHRQRKWASERALGLRDENNNEIVPPPVPGAVEQSPRSATANDGVEKGEPLNESETQSPTAQTERKPEEITPVTEETTGKTDAGVTGRALTGEREGLMEITNEDLVKTTTLTEEDLADPEAGALKRAARRNAERQRDAAIAYSRGEIKDKPENFDYWKNRLGLEEPKAKNAMQPVGDVPEEQKADSKEAEGAGTDRSPQGELTFGEETPEQRETREKQERVAKAASLRSRHTQLSEEIKQKQLEYRFMNDRKKQYQARQELNKLYDEIESVEQQLKETGEPMQVKRFNRPAKKERTQHAARKAYDEMRKKYKDDSEVMEILDDTEPQDIYEQIGIALGSSKLLFKSKGEGASRKRGIADETGWKWNDVKGMFQLFDNEKGQSVSEWAETFWADLDEGAKNRYSDSDIKHMMLDVLGGASTIGDLRNIVLANRVRQAEELLEHREKEEEYWRDMERHEQEMRETEEEAMLEHIKDLAENFDEQEYYSKFADEILKAQRDDSTGSNRDLPQGERGGFGNEERSGETGERETAGNRDNKDNASIEVRPGETGADSQENGREPKRLDSQRVSQERAGLSAKEREIVNRVNAGINEAIDDLDAEIRDLEKKGDEEGAEAARLEKEMLENSREDMIDDALDEFNYYEENKGNMTSYEKAAVESRERSLAERKAKRMRELLEKLRDPNTSDAKRRAVVRQLADLGVEVGDGVGVVSERVQSYQSIDGGVVRFESAKQLSLFGSDTGTRNLFDGFDERRNTGGAAFDVKKMSDEELLTEIGGDENSLNSRLSSDEYDRRHLKEYNQAYDAITRQLEENRTTKDQADEMLCDIVRQWRDGHATGERTPLKAQFDALNDYYTEKEAEEQARRDEIEDVFSEAIDKAENSDKTNALIKLFNEFDKGRISGNEALSRLEALQKQAVEGQKSEAQPQTARTEQTMPTEEAAQVSPALTVEVEKPKVERKEKTNPAGIKLRKLAKDEMCHVERRYVESKQFDFTGSEVIKGSNDIAYLFRQLENSAIENVFLVLLDKNNRPTILHIGMGGYNLSIGNIGAGILAASAIKPKRVILVHNHPSGVLKPSPQDVDLLKKTWSMFGNNVVADGIIIDITSGKYCEFGASGYHNEMRPERIDNEIPHKVYSFSKSVFDKDWNPETAFQVRNSDDVAKYVSSHRLGEHDKYSLLVLDNQHHVTANVFLPWTDLNNVDMKKSADEVSKYVHQMGGLGAVLYGNGRIPDNVNELRKALKDRFVDLLDFVTVDDGSAANRRLLREPGSEYLGTDNISKSTTASEDVLGYETSSRNTELRYRFEEGEKPTFYSNAERAVEGIQEKTDENGNVVLYQRGNGRKLILTPEETALRDGLVEKMRSAGIEVVTNDAEGQRVLDAALRAEELLDEMKRKSAQETALPEGETSFKGTVISSADGAKVIQNLETLIKNAEKLDAAGQRNFLGEVAKALGARRYGSGSQYATFETVNGEVVTIRLADHNAHVSGFDNAGRDNGISIVISRKPNNGVLDDGDAHVVEFFYKDKDLRKADGSPYAAIVRSIEQALYSGEYKDTTGLAQREEVNGENLIREMRAWHGSGADFDAFDHAHMGEGEGAQAYGWGTYVTEVEGIGRAYARSSGGRRVFYDGREVDPHSRGTLAEHCYAAVARRVLDGMMTAGEYIADRLAHYDMQLVHLRESGSEQFIADTEKLRDVFASMDAGLFKLVEGPAVLYEVEVPDNDGSNYLSWAEPLSDEQLERITSAGRQSKEFAENFNLKNDPLAWAKVNEKSRRGDNVYSTLSNMLGARKASELLSQAGFVGIEYPAQYRSGGRSDGAMNHVIFNEKDIKIVSKTKLFRTANGDVYGFVRDGKIYLDPKIANSETAVHEYSHLWSEALRKSNPKAWEQLKSELLKDKETMDVVKKLYPELEGDALMDEVFSNFSGKRGAEKLRAEQERLMNEAKDESEKSRIAKVFDRIKRALDKYWNMARDLMAGKTKGIEKLSAEDFADMALNDLLRGEKPNAEGKQMRENRATRYEEMARGYETASRNTEQRDREYAEAVEKGDTKKVQRMLEEEAGRTMHAVDVTPEMKASVMQEQPLFRLSGNEKIRVERDNARFNEEVERLTEKNADATILQLGMPSGILKSVGIADKPMRLYGNKLMSKARKHGFSLSEIKNLPIAVSDPIMIFEGSDKGSHSILTELKTASGNVLANIAVGKGNMVDFNIIRSVYGKNEKGITKWILDKKMLYSDKERALDFLNNTAPIAGTERSQELDNVAKIIKEFENPSDLVRENAINEIREAVEAVNGVTGGRAKVVREADLGKDVPKNAQAWYDPNTGEVHVVAERVNGAEDASRAVWHEEIGHKAMSEDKINCFLGAECGAVFKKCVTL